MRLLQGVVYPAKIPVAYSLLVIIYIPTFYKLFSYGWKVADYSHGPLILLVFLWLIWRKKGVFSSSPSDNRVHPFALSVLLIGLFLYTVGSIHKILMVETFSLIPVLIGTTGFLLGREALRQVLFPAVFLIFLIPPPLFFIDMLTSPLKMIVASVSEPLLRFAGYLVSRNGVILFIGDYSIVVGDECSGIRSLISLMSVGAVYAYLQNVSNLKKSVLFLSIIPIAICANIFRLMLLALITYHFGEAAGQGFFHNFSGILLFIIALISLIILDVLIDRRNQNDRNG
ncbi:MAG: exosortase [Nitrospirae bacterium]|nr:exosortase [Nitrospirota bacterium]